jgi:hypothetical protein
MNNFAKAVVVVIVMIILGVIGMTAFSKDLQHMVESISGYWVGKDTFLRENNYSDFQLFISPKTDQVHHGYVIIARNKNILYNSPVTIRLKAHKKQGLQVHGTISFENHGDFEIQLPEEADIVWSVTGDNFLITDKNGKVVFDGYKDIYTSLVSQKEWNSFNYQEQFDSISIQ